MTYEELIEPIVATIERESDLERSTIQAYLVGWETVPAVVGGKHVATAILRGTEIHFALVDGWKPQSCHRGAIKDFLQPLLDRRGFLTTRIMHSKPQQKTFVKRVGFKPTWQDGTFRSISCSAACRLKGKEMHFKRMPTPLPAGYQKTYLSVAMSRAYSMDNPVGDPFGGPAYGEKNGPVAAIALPVLGMAGSYAAFAAATTTLGAVMAGAAFVGSTMSLVGNITGNAKLSKFGSVLSIAGGLGMGADALLSGGNFTFSGGEASGAPEWLQSTQSSLGMTPTTTPVAPAEAMKADMAAGPTADMTSPSASYAGGNVNAPGASGLNAPGGMASPLNAGPGAPLDQFGTGGGAPFDAFGSPTSAMSDIALTSNPGATATGVGADAAATGMGSGFLKFANANPMVTMMGFQAVGGLTDYLSGKTDAEIDALQAQIGYADARAMQIQEQLALEKQRRANLNAGYQQVNTGIGVNPNASIQMPWTQQQQPPGLIAGNMPPQG